MNKDKLYNMVRAANNQKLKLDARQLQNMAVQSINLRAGMVTADKVGPDSIGQPRCHTNRCDACYTGDKKLDYAGMEISLCDPCRSKASHAIWGETAQIKYYQMLRMYRRAFKLCDDETRAFHIIKYGEMPE